MTDKKNNMDRTAQITSNNVKNKAPSLTKESAFRSFHNGCFSC